jgi:hypothetical protein
MDLLVYLFEIVLIALVAGAAYMLVGRALRRRSRR